MTIANVNEIDWDMYVLNTPYSDVLDGMGFARKIQPTMFSKCKQYIFLADLDLEYKIDDIHSLQNVLKDVTESLKSLTKEFQDNPSLSLIEQLHQCKVNYMLLSRLVSEQSNGKIEYLPESIFYQVENS